MKKISFAIVPLMAFSLFSVGCVNQTPTKNEFCSVSFSAGGGKVTSANPVVVPKGESVPMPTLDDRPGYDKDKVVWRDKDYNPFSFSSTKVTNDMILYADWGKITTYHVTFYFEDEVYDTEDVEFNHKVHRIENPSDNFDNWYTDNTYSEEFNFDEELTGESRDINIYGCDKEKYEINIVGNHITEKVVTFRKGNHQPITTQVTVLDDHHLTGEFEVEPSDAAEVTLVDTSTIKITPKADKPCKITLDSEYVPTYYDVNTAGLNLTFYRDEEMHVPLIQTSAQKNENFVFYMVGGRRSANSEEYIPPTSLMINIGGEEKFNIIEIQDVEGEYKNIEKRVIIPAKYITGDITIIGIGVKVDYYQITCPYLFGMKQPEIETTFHAYSEEATFEFIAGDDAKFSTELLTAENIYVNFTGKDDGWISPAEEAFSNYGKFEHTADDHYILTIEANKVDKGINTVQIVARTQDYPTLEKVSWNEIDYVSTKGFAPSLFSIGDTKTVSINDIKYSVRILDFNHDPLTSDPTRTAGITFEFVNVFNDFKTPWNNGSDLSHNYPNSNLAESHKETGTLYKKIPPDLKSVLQSVEKHFDYRKDSSSAWDGTKTYSTKLFPLSAREINHNNPADPAIDTPYAYYVNCAPAMRKKTNTAGKALGYWLRTPVKYGTTDDYAYIIADNGEAQSMQISDAAPHLLWYAAPAFCVGGYEL